MYGEFLYDCRVVLIHQNYTAALVTLCVYVIQSVNSFTLTVGVQDCNDEPPVFSSFEYDFSLQENTPAGTTLSGSISTTDADIDTVNRAVTYSLADGLSSTLNWLDINPTTVSSITWLFQRLAQFYYCVHTY